MLGSRNLLEKQSWLNREKNKVAHFRKYFDGVFILFGLHRCSIKTEKGHSFHSVAKKIQIKVVDNYLKRANFF